MKYISSFLTLFLLFSFTQLEAKCDCKGNEIITVCQNGKTKRVNCSALSSPNVFCGPCSKKPDCTPGASCDDGNPCTKWDKYDNNCNCFGKFADKDKDGVCDAVDRCPDGDDLKDKDKNGMPDDCEKEDALCNECEVDEKGLITICWIPHNKDNFRTVKGNCDYISKFFDEDGNLKGKNVCGPCECELIGDTDSDGDGVCDRKDQCPDNPDKSKPGPCGCDDQDSDMDWVCDVDDLCIGHNDKEDADSDGTPDGCDVCPDNPNFSEDPGPCGCDDQDTDGDGTCDSEDCAPNDPIYPATPGTSCNDGDENTENDEIGDDGCSCLGTEIACEIRLVIVEENCDDNGTPGKKSDDSYTVSITAEAIANAGDKWGGLVGVSDPDLTGTYLIEPTDYGETVDINLSAGGAKNVGIQAIGKFSCFDGELIQAPETCGCDDQDNDEVCDTDDICPGFDDNQDQDNDGIPDGCDACPSNPNITSDPGPCGCNDQDSDGDGICDQQDCDAQDPDLPTIPGSACDDGNPLTENDQITSDGCGCQGTLIPCEIELSVLNVECTDNGTPGDPSDDLYSFSFTVNAVSNAGLQWEGGFDNAYLGAFLIPPTAYGETIDLGPFPAASFTPGNVFPPTVIDGGMPININVNSVGDASCKDQMVVESPGSCPCEDADQDLVCDNDDICPGHDDRDDQDGDGTPDGCDQCPINPDLTEPGECGCDVCPPDPCEDFCQPVGNSDREWIDKVSLNQLENSTGPNEGYGDYRHMFIELGHGDSLSLWVFPGFLENICELSIHIYADWNGDCDFDDEGELILWDRTLNETGADIAIPHFAIEGDITIRFMLNYGRITSACQPGIHGEIEDYTLRIFSRNPSNSVGSTKNDGDSDLMTGQSALRVFPNPVLENNSFVIQHDLPNSEEINVNIYSLDGNLISTLSLENSENEFATDFLNAGVYIFELNTKDQTIRETLIIQK